MIHGGPAVTNLAVDITRYQDPAQARIRELEESVRRLLEYQLRAEQEIRRLQTAAAQAEVEAKQLRAELAREITRGDRP